MKQFSQKLNKKVLTYYHWVLLEKPTKTKVSYVFRPDGRLLVAENGIIIPEKWEFLSNNTILITRSGQTFLYNSVFIDYCFLVLKLDGKDDYSIMVNEMDYQKDIRTLSELLNHINEEYISMIDEDEDEEYLKSIMVKVRYIHDGFDPEIGEYHVFMVADPRGVWAKMMRRKSDHKYFVYGSNKVEYFPSREACLNYIWVNNIKLLEMK